MNLNEVYENAVLDRVEGAYPVAIATSLALEGAMGIHPEQEKIKKQAKLTDFNILAINLRTLVRNYLNAIDLKEKDEIPYDLILKYLAQEINSLRHVTNELNIVLKIYQINHTFTILKMRNAIPRNSNNRQYIHLLDFLSRTDKHLTKMAMEENNQEDLNINNLPSPALVITHQPLDLFYLNTTDSLLESHTGVIKRRVDWGTKLHTNKYELMPFNSYTVQIFGDNDILAPIGVVHRRAFTNLAEEYKWNQNTTTGRMKDAVSRLKDQGTRDYLQTLFSGTSL